MKWEFMIKYYGPFLPRFPKNFDFSRKELSELVEAGLMSSDKNGNYSAVINGYRIVIGEERSYPALSTEPGRKETQFYFVIHKDARNVVQRLARRLNKLFWLIWKLKSMENIRLMWTEEIGQIQKHGK